MVDEHEELMRTERRAGDEIGISEVVEQVFGLGAPPVTLRPADDTPRAAHVRVRQNCPEVE